MEKIHPDILACYLYVITKYGYPPDSTGTFTHLRELKSLGFSSVELEGIREKHLDGMYSIRHGIKIEADALGLKIPVFCVVLPGLSSSFRAEREKNLLLFEKGCEIAQVLGSSSVLDNSPIPPWQFPDEIPVTRHYDEDVLSSAILPEKLNWKSYWNDLAMVYRDLCDIAKSKGLNYHLHPCFGALVDSTDSYLLFSSAVKRDNLKFNLDTANQFFMKDNLFLSLVRLEGHIEYIHVSDNRGFRVEHLEAGKGSIDWDRFFETLDRINYKGRFGIDVGGAESGIEDLDNAYKNSAKWLQEKWINRHQA